MNETSKFEQGWQREEDPVKLEAKKLFNTLATQYGTETILKYIEEKTDIAPIVTREWLEGQRQPSSGIRKDIFYCLRNFSPQDLPAPEQSPEIPKPKAEKPPRTSDQKTGRKLKRETTIKKNEEELQAIIERLKQKGQISDK